MKKKLIIIGPVLLVVALAAFMFLRPSAPAPDPKELAKEPGPVYTMVEPFVVNLADRGTPRLAKVGVALQVSKASAALVPVSEGSKVAKVEMDAQIRDIVIAALQQNTAVQLSSAQGRRAVKKVIVTDVNKQTELKIIDVYYTEFAVQ